METCEITYTHPNLTITFTGAGGQVVVYTGSTVSITEDPRNADWILFSGQPAVGDTVVDWNQITIPASITDRANAIAQIQGLIDVLESIKTDRASPTGIVGTTSTYTTITQAGATFTATPVGSEIVYYNRGDRFITYSPISINIPALEGIHYVYMDGTTVKTTQAFNPPPTIRNYTLLGIVYWDATNGQAIFVGRETHGINMAEDTHAYLHLTRGTVYASGYTLSNFTIGNGSLDSHAQFDISDGIIWDEDIELASDATTQTLAPLTTPVYYMQGAVGTWRRIAATAFPVSNAGTANGRLAYNQDVAGVWQRTEVGEGDYVLCHIFATNDVYYPVISIMGQATYGNINTARLGANTELGSLITTGLPTVEFVPIATVIYQTDKDYGNTIRARVVQTDLGGNYIDFRTANLSGVSNLTDHGELSGLADDDHMQYARLTERTGGGEQLNIGSILLTGGVQADATSVVPRSYVDLKSSTGIISWLSGMANFAAARTDYVLPRTGNTQGFPVSWSAPDACTLGIMVIQMDTTGEFTAGTVEFKIWVNNVVQYTTGALAPGNMSTGTTPLGNYYFYRTAYTNVALVQDDMVAITATTSVDFAGGPEGPVIDINVHY